MKFGHRCLWAAAFLIFFGTVTTFAQPVATDDPGDSDAVLSSRNPLLRERARYETEDAPASNAIDRNPLPARVSPLPWLRHLGAARSQEARGTCSIFSVTAWAEAVIAGRTSRTFDFSEEWLKYVVSVIRSVELNSDGAFTQDVLGAAARYGMARESALRYVGETWTSLGDSIARSRCGFVPAPYRDACLIGHFDPRILNGSVPNPFPDLALAQTQGTEFTRAYDMPRCRSRGECSNRFFVQTPREAKQILVSGMPVILDVDFYYGAWNHSAARSLGIFRDFAAWRQGWVGFPTRDTIDRRRSNEPGYETGHSVLVIGYDDTKEITLEETLSDGSHVPRTYRGIYYIRNSWGGRGFGREFTYRGERFPGYGMISQKYAHQMGAFFASSLESR